MTDRSPYPYGVDPDQLDPAPADLGARIIDAAGKGQVALLVTDAAGTVIIGIKATGGLTELRPDGGGRWLFAGALSGKPTILDGSYALRNALGAEADTSPDDYDLGDPANDLARAVVPLPELESGYVSMPDYPDDARRLEQARRLARAEGRQPPEQIEWTRVSEPYQRPQLDGPHPPPPPGPVWPLATGSHAPWCAQLHDADAGCPPRPRR